VALSTVFSRLLVATRIYLGFLLVFGLLVTTAAVSYIGFTDVHDRFGEFAGLNELVITAQTIDRTVLDLRHQVLLFSDSGDQAVLETIRDLKRDLLRQIDRARRLAVDAADAPAAAQMLELFNSFSVNFDTLVELRGRLDRLVSQRLEADTLGLHLALEAVQRAAAAGADGATAVLAAEAFHHLSATRRSLSSLVVSAGARIPGSMPADSAEDLKALGVAVARLAGQHPPALADLVRSVTLLSGRFRAAYQDTMDVTTAYQRLAHGAVAAQAAEFGRLVSAQREALVQRLDVLTRETDRVMRTTVRVALLVAGGGLLLGLLVAFLISASIVPPLTAMTMAMTRLAAGRTAVDPPCLNNRDEIGDMAKAVQVFKQNALAIQRQSQFQKSLLEAIAIPVYYKDAGGRYLGCNRAFEEFVGRPRHEIIGRTVSDLFAPTRAAAAEAADRELLARGGSQVYEARLDSSWGDPRDMILSRATYQGEDGAVAGIVGTFVDITDRKHAVQLAAANRELEGLNRELEAFIYSVSHDLRAPLRALEGFSAALLEDYGERLDEEGHTYLNALIAGSEEMRALIEGLLKLSRTSRGEIKFEHVDLTAMARQCMAALAREQPQRQVTVAIEDGLYAEADPRLIRVVLENLLGNAWKYTGRCETAQIAFSRELRAEAACGGGVGGAGLGGAGSGGGGLAVFAIRDNGAGFDMEYADKLFKPFQRLHSVSEFDGTGIGLATVQRIIFRHGGQIWAESAVGQGAVFRFTLPGGGGPT